MLRQLCFFFLLLGLVTPTRDSGGFRRINPKKPHYPAPEAHGTGSSVPHFDRKFDLTWELWEYKKHVLNVTSMFPMDNPPGTCPMQGKCDDPEVRDFTNTDLKTVNVRTYIIKQNGGWPAGLTADKLSDQEDSLNADYKPHGIKLVFEDYELIEDPDFPNCIPVYSEKEDWLEAIDLMKARYFKVPETGLDAINVLVSCQTAGTEGTLLGIGTFPWDPAALTNQGGLWMNAAHISKDDKTYNHELGHNFGLWHTFHGVSEIYCPTTCGTPLFCTWDCACQDPCFEPPHTLSDPAYDVLGDFCSDTASTPRHWDCFNPTVTNQCVNVPWGETGYDNIMGYSPDDCIHEITPQQEKRIHCWLCASTPGVVSGCPSNTPSTPSSNVNWRLRGN